YAHHSISSSVPGNGRGLNGVQSQRLAIETFLCQPGESCSRGGDPMEFMPDKHNDTSANGRQQAPSSAPVLIEVRNLSISFRTSAGLLNIVPDLSFSISQGERLAVVGESGSGKTVTGLALLGLLPPAHT